MTTLLLTGGAGAIGCHLIAHLMEHTDWRVTVVDSFQHGGDHRRIRVAMEGHDPGRCRVVLKDLARPFDRETTAHMGRPEFVVHMAALSDVGESVARPRRTIRNNIDSTLNLLDWASTVDPTAFVLFSTDEVYGDVLPGEWRNPWDAHRPSNPYSASKAACEDFAYSYWRAGAVPLVVTNTTNNFGEMQGASKYPTLIQQRLWNGQPVTVHTHDGKPGSRYYLHSRQTAAAVLHILGLPVPAHVRGDVDTPAKYHIAGVDAVNNLELAELVADLMGRPLETELVDCHDVNPAHDLHYGIQPDGVPGWSAGPMLPDLERTVAWHMTHPEWIT